MHTWLVNSRTNTKTTASIAVMIKPKATIRLVLDLDVCSETPNGCANAEILVTIDCESELSDILDFTSAIKFWWWAKIGSKIALL